MDEYRSCPPHNTPIGPTSMFGRSASLSPQSSRRRSESYQQSLFVDSSSQEVFALKQERMVKVLALVEKRKNSFAYLKKTHEGGEFWLNCVQLRRCPDLEQYASEIPKVRITQLFYLGLSLARLLQMGGSGGCLVRGALQLFEEWEYHFAGHTAQSVRGIMAKGLEHPFPLNGTQTLGQGYDNGLPEEEENSPVQARLYKFGSDVVYEQLLTPPVPFALDYFEVFLSLCDILCLMYKQLLNEECYGSSHIFEALIKVDAKVKRHILNVTAKDFTDISAGIARVELTLLR